MGTKIYNAFVTTLSILCLASFAISTDNCDSIFAYNYWNLLPLAAGFLGILVTQELD